MFHGTSLSKLESINSSAGRQRDKAEGATFDDLKTIGDGNQVGYGGDAIADTCLYLGTEGRRDYGIYEKLYGFPPQIVRDITHAETISVLKTHVDVIEFTPSPRVAHGEVQAPAPQAEDKKFKELFDDFVRLLKESDYDCGYLQGTPTPLTQAYGAFTEYNYERKKELEKVRERERGGRGEGWYIDGVGA
ncbi:hypothetical protein B9Z19DRAFT_1122210 [Tuber borchii]|uniref:Uncharacterized protein n=1 Tax=Tuber borchii TaxID=42251 RepID=A0A2T7A150_TUBBO|nr:hypothetical protein B9Z19DRAFT_1122210 [Tuber borchii]